MDENKMINQGLSKGQELYDKGRDVAQQGYEKAQHLAETASERSRQALDRSKEALHTTDEWVHDNPWMTVGVIAAVGLVIGYLLGQGRRDD